MAEGGACAADEEIGESGGQGEEGGGGGDGGHFILNAWRWGTAGGVAPRGRRGPRKRGVPPDRQTAPYRQRLEVGGS
jgi:hypothetical protein